jgi:Pyruvate/2-oxoacid:ferredoxin oxidoreductase delta subunit
MALGFCDEAAVVELENNNRKKSDQSTARGCAIAKEMTNAPAMSLAMSRQSAVLGLRHQV